MSPPLISHVGIAVVDLEQSIARYRQILGVSPSDITEVADQRVRVAFFDTGEISSDMGGRIELVAATDSESPIARFLEKHGEGLHHICLYVDDLDTRLAELKASGVRLIDATPRAGAEGRRIAFVHPAATGGVLIELEERPTAPSPGA